MVQSKNEILDAVEKVKLTSANNEAISFLEMGISDQLFKELLDSQGFGK